MNQPRAARRSSGKIKPANSQVEPRSPKGFHPRNLHRDGYDFMALIEHTPYLKGFVRPNPYGNLSIDFSDPVAVKTLNLALLRLHYHIEFWDIPQGFLCPPIPGRVDYLHYIADLLSDDAASNSATKRAVKPPKGQKIKVLDIGTGANGIYPILGVQSYGWHFVASDIDSCSVSNVQHIIDQNSCLQGKVELRLQSTQQAIFNGMIKQGERFDVTMCNPPFHASLAEATAGSERKLKNLASNRLAKGHDKVSVKSTDKLNFGGQKAELWCDGGELRFLLDMIKESHEFSSQCLWFTSLVSKKENLKPCYRALEQLGAVTVKTIDMAQGNKLTRVLAWSFLEPRQRELWHQYRC
ncbi:23S rRNA (adenine(1618)-N(6))-methyltransferase RlmF [Shewanella psychrotolerans]|uniref:23S rRNA (adenine(1618)-N(6))-methyltransferase RlmF n=1 Tax=Shewanella psychrotolerans TaxID=2864206 RepID=UPI001C659B31|nr:23S rRNA (adenine(1618)-N(6))-methyltransferase RlmF [Shewanella psychrotolerans]QYK01339.1 23S rRNA (adenine(1618)-N(6))-methyltransferase RlmF [Shewanella psychrotolerans]